MHWESFAVRFEPGQSVFDGLRWIRSHRHPTLAVRYSCINAYLTVAAVRRRV